MIFHVCRRVQSDPTHRAKKSLHFSCQPEDPAANMKLSLLVILVLSVSSLNLPFPNDSFDKILRDSTHGRLTPDPNLLDAKPYVPQNDLDVFMNQPSKFYVTYLKTC